MQEYKNIIEQIVRGILKIFSSETFSGTVNSYIQKKYDSGLMDAEEIFNINFVRDQKNLDFLQDYVKGLVGNTVEQIDQDLRAELQRDIMAGMDIPQIKKRVKKVFKDPKYFNRLKTVLRTEGARAAEIANLDAAKQTGLNVRKWLDVIVDDRTSPVCRAANKKYGSKDQAIPLNEQFVIKYKVRSKNKTKGEVLEAMTPPLHINCRSSLRFTEVDTDESL